MSHKDGKDCPECETDDCVNCLDALHREQNDSLRAENERLFTENTGHTTTIDALQADLDGYKKAASYWKDHYDRTRDAFAHSEATSMKEIERLREDIANIKDRGQETLDALIDMVRWDESIGQSCAYPVKKAREILAREDAMGGWNKL